MGKLGALWLMVESGFSATTPYVTSLSDFYVLLDNTYFPRRTINILELPTHLQHFPFLHLRVYSTYVYSKAGEGFQRMHCTKRKGEKQDKTASYFCVLESRKEGFSFPLQDSWFPSFSPRDRSPLVDERQLLIPRPPPPPPPLSPSCPAT